MRGLTTLTSSSDELSFLLEEREKKKQMVFFLSTHVPCEQDSAVQANKAPSDAELAKEFYRNGVYLSKRNDNREP